MYLNGFFALVTRASAANPVLYPGVGIKIKELGSGAAIMKIVDAIRFFFFFFPEEEVTKHPIDSTVLFIIRTVWLGGFSQECTRSP